MLLAIVLALLALCARVAAAEPARAGDAAELDAAGRAADAALDAGELDAVGPGGDAAGLDADDLEDLLDHADGVDALGGPRGEPDELDELRANDDLDDLDELRQIDDLDDLDPELDPVGDDTTWPVAGASEQRDAADRRTRSPIGRVDVSTIWRRTDTFSQARHDEVWLLGTWRL